MRRKFIIGNWKMYATSAEARRLAKAVVGSAKDFGRGRPSSGGSAGSLKRTLVNWLPWSYVARNIIGPC